MDEDALTVRVETFVVLTSLLLVVRFLLDFRGPWQRAWSSMNFLIPLFEGLNNIMFHYTMARMQLSADNVNPYFQVWGVLLTTLQYSVKTGRPYSRSRQIPLTDLTGSFSAANLLRLRTFLMLRTPLWLLWALNAARIISYFVSSEKEAINQQSLRLTADYMSYEHGIIGSSSSSSSSAAAAADPSSPGKGLFTMDSYKYLVLGENQVVKDIIQEDNRLPAVQTHQQHAQRRAQQKKHRIRLDPAVHHKLITLDKIWSVDSGKSRLLGATADKSNRLKDVCLSFALYKLLRRRFYDLPLHEARLPRQGEKMRRLVFEYILRDAERAFRVVGTQLSFLQDFFYSKHATTFADGFPVINLVLSLLLVLTTGYIAYPVGYIPEWMDKVADPNSRMIITHHGVLITRLIVALIIGKELAEIYMYFFSRWSKVLMLCSYAKHRCLRCPLIESAMRVMLVFMIRDGWDEKICQHNILISARGVKLGTFFTWVLCTKFPKGIKMEACTKEAIFQSIKRLENNPERLDSYFANAFGEPNQRLHRQFLWAVDNLEADTHRILVWHIATCLCEIDLLSDEEAVAFRPGNMRPGPFVKRPVMGSNDKQQPDSGSAGSVEAAMPTLMWWEHYRTAASLSNYCAYLVMQKLVPDNGLIAAKVWSEVYREIVRITMDGSIGSLLKPRSMKDVFTRLMRTANMPRNDQTPHAASLDPSPWHASRCGACWGRGDQTAQRRRGDPPAHIKNFLGSKGAELAKQLMEEYREDKLVLWEKLADFWTGFLLHLAASTRASKHKALLAGSRELTTHLWALLSHASFLGRTSHGQVALDQLDRSALEMASAL